MNKTGQQTLVGVMIMIFVFATAVVLLAPLKELIVEARSADSLDCENTSISLGTKGTCLIVDFYMPYFFGVVVFGAASFLVLRRVFGE